MARQCTHSPRAGIVVNESQRGEYRDDKPHASRNVCHRPECQAAGIQWAASFTNERSVFVSNEELAAMRAAKREASA